MKNKTALYMKLFINILIVISLAAAGSVTAEREPGNGLLSDLRLPMIEFHPPAPGVRALAHDALLLTQPDDSLPFLTLEITFPGGTNSESVAEAGQLAAMTKLLSIGGAGERTGDQIADLFASLGAKFYVKEEYEQWTVHLTVLKRDFDAAYGVLSDILLRPQLPSDRLEVIKSGMLAEIAQRNDDPADTGFRKMLEVLYPGARRGHSLQPEDIQAITLEKVRECMNRRRTARHAILSVSGDFRGIELDAKLIALLSAMGDAEAPEPERGSDADWESHANQYRGKIVLVETQAVQSAIYMASFLPGHNSRDFYALQVSNFILGGGEFNSRLMAEIRARQGLAYYAYSMNNFLASRGEFIATSATRTPAAARTLQAMLAIIDSMKNPVSEDELSLARETILNRMAFQFDDPAETLKNEVRFRIHDMPADYLSTISQRIRAVTGSDVNSASSSYYRTNELFIVVVGPGSLRSDLEKIRPVVRAEPERPL